ncbi:MAG TPA: hypothetical protein VMI94_01810 [Bryobacteraceae bacterium]|nr:hypothetical protein [Bryobacteraceae bacterium]
MTKNKCALFMIVAGAMLASPAVQAQTWSTIGSSCQPGSASIGLYSYSDATFQFASGETGQISTRCQVNDPLDSGVPAWKTLTVGYVDPDGTQGNYEVQAKLLRVAKGTGVETTIVIFDSDAHTQKVATSKSVTFTHTFDFTNYSYFVSLVVNRGDSSANPGVWFASLK